MENKPALSTPVAFPVARYGRIGGSERVILRIRRAEKINMRGTWKQVFHLSPFIVLVSYPWRSRLVK